MPCMLDLCAKQVANRGLSSTDLWSVVSSWDHGLVGTLRFCRDCGWQFFPLCVFVCEHVALAVLLVCVWSRSCNNLWICDVYTFPDIFKSVPLWSLCPGLWWAKLWRVSEHSRVYFQFRTRSEKEERGKKINSWVTRLGRFVGVTNTTNQVFMSRHIAHCRQTNYGK